MKMKGAARKLDEIIVGDVPRVVRPASGVLMRWDGHHMGDGASLVPVRNQHRLFSATVPLVNGWH